MRKATIGKLTKAFEFVMLEKNTVGKIDNPLVISQLQSIDRLDNIYLIAKNPDENMFYGLIEIL